MASWSTLRNWKFYYEFVTGLALTITAVFLWTAMDKNHSILEHQRQADRLINHVTQAESQLQILSEPAVGTSSTYYLESLNELYLGPLTHMRGTLINNQNRIESTLELADAVTQSKLNLLNGMSQLEEYILESKLNAVENTSQEMVYMSTVSAWLTQLKTALYTGDLSQASVDRLNQLTRVMQSQTEESSILASTPFSAALSLYMNQAQQFLDQHSTYQLEYANTLTSVTGLKLFIESSTQQWLMRAQQNLLVLWIACMMGIALTGGLFWNLFHTKHFNTMMAAYPQEALAIENTEFIHQVDELLNIVDQNWLDSRRESSVLNDTVLMNEDVKRNMHQLEHDLKSRNSHEESVFESLLSSLHELRSKFKNQEITEEDFITLEKSIQDMQHHLILDNKSVHDDLSGVENSLFNLNGDMKKLQEMMGRVVEDSRKLLKMRHEIEETEQIAESLN